ncbi:hypothetical protein JYU34_006305 [Plutella xylostella]|uniref:Zinc finger protein n=1 Tax=Plutella xylostella TaxID=51655 RepID=A0ABQ7QRR6_PLUXY|nr:hypothetical protein JYU34_006305 [Plutella xylostella]
MLSPKRRPFRTYARKRPQFQEIEGVKDACRLCLKKSPSMVSIFSSEPSDVSSLATRIMLCVGLEMTCEEQLPSMICMNCHSQLEMCYKFRKMCETAYQKLKLHLQAVKIKEFQLNNPVKVEKDEKETLVNEVEDQVEINVESIDAEPLRQADVTDKMEYIDAVLVISNDDGNIMYDNENSQIGDIRQSTTEINEEISQIQPIEVVNHNQQVSLLKSSHSQGFVQNIPQAPPPNDSTSAESLLLLLREELASAGVLGAGGEPGGDPGCVLELVTRDGSVVVLQLEEEEVEDDIIKSIRKCKGNLKKEEDTQCRICNKRFSRRGALRRHERAHGGARPFACAQCGRTFTQKEVMKRHELIHRDKRPFACTQCPKSFTQRGALTSHARAHGAAMTLHACPHCRKVFLHASGLSRHVKTHSGCVFHCGECGRGFKDKSSLKRHIRNNTHKTTLAPPVDT